MIKQISNIIFGILYAFIGILTIYKDWFIVELNSVAAKTLGALFIVYGLFRIYRGFKALRSKDN